MTQFEQRSGDQSSRTFAFISDATAMESAEIVQIMDEFERALAMNDGQSQLAAATRLMTGGAYAQAIQAFTRVGQSHPEVAGSCAGNIGASYFFLGDYAQAITWYETAKQHGAPADLMDDNIAEAREAMSGEAGGAAPSASPRGSHSEQTLQTLLGGMQLVKRGKFHASPDIPEKKLRNVRERVLLPHEKDARVLAVLDLTVWGSAKDALVFTDRAITVRDMDEHFSVDLVDITRVGEHKGLAAPVVEAFAGDRKIALPCAGEEDALMAVLGVLVSLNRALAADQALEAHSPAAYSPVASVASSASAQVVACFEPSVVIQASMLELAAARLRAFDPASTLTPSGASGAAVRLHGLEFAVEVRNSAFDVHAILEGSVGEPGDTSRLARHRSHALITCTSSGAPALEQYLAAHRVADAFAGGYEGLSGVVIPAASTHVSMLAHRTLTTAEGQQRAREVLPLALFIGFWVAEAPGGKLWCRTLGASIFGVPDLCTCLVDDEEPSDAHGLFNDVLTYAVGKRVPLEPGHTLSVGAGGTRGLVPGGQLPPPMGDWFRGCLMVLPAD